ncbi:MAG TPA: Hpt domain-containing protein [Roseococcus sp.]|jgi:HPt (histidine-containing phosphotransfer) domain-containing protein|nr:Hpt domain-containing protein [Roseococcus sp.]
MDTINSEVARQLAEELPPSVLRSIITTFEADIGRLAQELLAAGRAGNAEGYHRAAHSIAGAASAVGASRLEREARLAMNPAHDEPPHVVMPRLMLEAKAAIEALRLLRP